jgi:hypothetical protein
MTWRTNIHLYLAKNIAGRSIPFVLSNCLGTQNCLDGMLMFRY